MPRHLFLALWLLATLFFGGVARIYEQSHLLLATVLCAILFFFVWRRKDWKTLPPTPFLLLGSLGAGLLVSLFLFQLLPLPGGVLQAFAPFSGVMTYGTLHALEIKKEFYYPISLNPQATTIALEQLLAFFLLFAASTVSLPKPEQRTRLAIALLSASGAIAFFGLIHRFSGTTEMYWLFTRGWTFFGPYISGNHAGALFATTAALTLGLVGAESFSKTDRAALYFVLGLTVLGLLFTGSRAAVLALAVAATLHFLVVRPKREEHSRLGLTVLGIAFGIAVAWNASFLSRIVATAERFSLGQEFRLNFWGYAIDLWQRSPIFGIGFGAFSRLSPMMAGDSIFLHAEHAENDLLELLSSGGLVGFLLVSIPLFFLLRKIVQTLRSPQASHTRQAFGLAIVALVANSLFVFNAPLPAHQILFALLLAGFLASGRTSLLSVGWMRRSLLLLLIVSLALGLHRLIRPTQTTPFRTNPSVESALTDRSPANRQAAFLSIASQAEAHILQDPLDDQAIYTLALASAQGGENERAEKGLTLAGRLNPFDLYHQVEIARYLGQEDPETTLDLIQDVLGGKAPIASSVRHGLHLEAALHALRLGKRRIAKEHLESVDAISDDWRVPLLRMLMTDNAPPLVRESWKRAQEAGVKSAVWDDYFLRAAREQKTPINLDEIISLPWNRPDIGLFLLKLAWLDPKRKTPLTHRFDLDLKRELFRPNTAQSGANSRMIGPILDIEVIRNQSALDAYMVPTNLLLAPANLSVRMVVNSKHRLKGQLLVEVDGKLFLTKEPARKIATGSWEMTFSNLGVAIPADDSQKPRTITGIGFTPLEKDGRYIIETIELFLSSTPSATISE